jgi:hypothetical protein
MLHTTLVGLQEGQRLKSNGFKPAVHVPQAIKLGATVEHKIPLKKSYKLFDSLKQRTFCLSLANVAPMTAYGVRNRIGVGSNTGHFVLHWG